ncbi:HNH endonuclease [Streptomyces hainanensis]|uniref:HNH endonuclease n=1 Tax=Streptomyces hainanensis TaxID=402648 RepID=UPI003C79974E
MPPETDRLLRSLSPECAICGTFVLPLEVAHIVNWPETLRAIESIPASAVRAQLAEIAFHDPWNALPLCRDRIRRTGCHDKEERGEITKDRMRHARAALDLQPGADRLYRRFVSQSLMSPGRTAPVDVAALGRALALARSTIRPGEPARFHLQDGAHELDFQHGYLSGGHFSCSGKCDGH